MYSNLNLMGNVKSPSDKAFKPISWSIVAHPLSQLGYFPQAVEKVMHT